VVPECQSCPWPAKAKQLEEELVALRGEMAEIKRMVFGQRSERMPTVGEELRREDETGADRAETTRRRRERRAVRERIEERQVRHAVPSEAKVCPKCGRTDLRPVGEGKVSTVYEYIPARFVRHKHVRETLACPCGEYVVTAEVPAKVVDKGQYGPSFVGHLVTSKCGDSLPFYRMEKQYRRLGIPISRSTMVDLFHGAADLLRPVYDRLLAIIAREPLVQADETTMRVLAPRKTRTSYLWTFLAGDLIAYRFSPSRSGETPREVLGATEGTLVVDGYTGYNAVCDPEARIRAGCWAHARRRFFEALPTAPAAQTAMDFILDLYRVEQEARKAAFAGTAEHLALRRTRSRATIDALARWLEEEKPKHLPKGPMGKAITYAQNNWTALTRFLEDPKIPIDNNASERALRVAALGRKNFLFVGNDHAGQNTAMLYSLVSTCEANDVNPEEYLADVLLRIQDHPQRRIDDLLPQNWKPPPAEAAA
jgi:transposase